MKKITLPRRFCQALMFIGLLMGLLRVNNSSAQLGNDDPAKDITIRVLDENGDGIKGVTVFIINASHPCDCDPYNGDKCLLNVIKSKESAKDGWTVFDAKDFKPNTNYIATINPSCNKIGDCKTGGDKDCKFDPGSDEEFTTNKIGGYNKGIPLTQVKANPNNPNGVIKSGIGMGGKTLFGTVMENEGYKKTEFTTPNGNLILYTTSDQELLSTGKTLRGTVVAEPSGNTEKEKDNNLAHLEKLSLTIGSTVVALRGLQQTIEYAGNKSPDNSFNVSLSDPSGKKENVKWLIAKDPVNTYSGNDGPMPQMWMNENMVLGDNLIVLHAPTREDAQFERMDRFSLVDSKGKNFNIEAVAESPRNALMMIPGEAANGSITISRSRGGKKMDEVNFDYADLQLSSPNTNLRRGEKSSVSVQIFRGDDMPDKKPQPYQVILTNVNPTIVTMQGGNLQAVTFPAGDGNAWSINRGIEGIVPGVFAVNARLVSDYNNSKDAFAAEKEAIADPSTFNRWVTALKTDLTSYANAQANDKKGQNSRANALRAAANLPSCRGAGELNACKMMTDELLMPLQIPKGAANSWLSGYEAMKAASDELADKLAGKDAVVYWDLIRSGAEFARNAGVALNDKQLSDEGDHLIKELPSSATMEISKTNLSNINRDLHNLIARTDPKINQSNKSFLKYASTDLLLATTMMNATNILAVPVLFSIHKAWDFDKKPPLYTPDDLDGDNPLPPTLHAVSDKCDSTDVFEYLNESGEDLDATLIVQNLGDCGVRVKIEKVTGSPGHKKKENGEDKDKPAGSTTEKDKGKGKENGNKGGIKTTPMYKYDVEKQPGADVFAFKIPKGTMIRVTVKCEGIFTPCDFTRKFSVTRGKTTVDEPGKAPKLVVDPPIIPPNGITPYTTSGNRCMSHDSIYFTITNKDLRDTMTVYYKAVSECLCYFEAYPDLNKGYDESGDAKKPKTGENKLGQGNYNGNGEIAKGNNKNGAKSTGLEQSVIIPPGKKVYFKGRCPEQLQKEDACKGSVEITGITYRIKK